MTETDCTEATKALEEAHEMHLAVGGVKGYDAHTQSDRGVSLILVVSGLCTPPSQWVHVPPPDPSTISFRLTYSD